MYGLPISTERKKQLPKKAIYAKFDLKPSQRESFDEDIARIDIVAVVSSATVPALSKGADIKEFYLLAVQMKRKEYDTKNIAFTIADLLEVGVNIVQQWLSGTNIAKP